MMSIPDAPIQRRKLADEVRDRLVSLIHDAALGPGDALPSERDLMGRFGVGRPAVREAMQSMASRGLIEIRHGDRARVAEPSVGQMLDQISETAQHLLSNSPASLENLKDARSLFEVEMVKRAARDRSAEEMHRLWTRIAEQESALDDPAEFLRSDGAFHREIAAVSRNPILSAVSEAMFRWLSEFHVSLVRVPGCEDVTLSEHRKIAQAIESQSEELAATYMADHLSRANDLYRRAHFRPLSSGKR
jgi:DNA-binding FadR family transcriptional regulator